ncbi:MAG: ABC transporter permease [Clostridiales Family XIII bacterium]|jgi:NitT/TauT family transport system permease protein|nr:ABC transporter permease [Clostridiales Family XIII bacterium]
MEELELQEKKPNILLTLYQKSILIVVLLILWAVVPLYLHNIYVPPLGEVLQEFAKLASTGELFKHIGASLKIALIGLAISQALAIPLGVLIGWFKKIDTYLDPLLVVMRNTSILAILPLFVLFLGIGEVSKIAIIVWGCFFPTLINTIQGVKTVDQNLIRSAQSMGISTTGLFFKVVIPASSPYILAGFRLSASIALIVLVGAEMVGAFYGIGFMIFNAQHAYMIPRMYVGILTLAILGVLVNLLSTKLENSVLRWQETNTNAV